MNFAGEDRRALWARLSSPAEVWGRRNRPHAPTQSSNYVCMRPRDLACQHASLDRAEAGAQTIIEHLIADPNNQTTNQRWVDTIAQFQPLAITRTQIAGDLGALLLVQLDCANY